MTMAGVAAAPVELETRVARERAVAVLGSLLAASVCLVLVVGLSRASAWFVVAAIVATAGLRLAAVLGLATGGDPAALPERTRRLVFGSSVAGLLVAPVAHAAFSPAFELAATPWRSVAIAAFVSAGIGAQSVFHAVRWMSVRAGVGVPSLGSPRAAHPRTDAQRSNAPRESGSDDRTLDRLAGRIRQLVLATSLGGLALLGDGTARSIEQAWRPDEVAVGVFVFALGTLLIAVLVARSVVWELRIAFADRAPLTTGREDDRPEELARAVSALVAGIDRSGELIRRFEGERDQQAIEQTHAVQVVRTLAASCESAAEGAAGASARIESSKRAAEAGRTGADALERQSAGLANEVESASRWLATAVRGAKSRTTSIDRLSTASRDAAASVGDLARAMREVDGSAVSIAELSRDVVARAEIGRAKVAETIAGMEEIRSATHAAESVIRGLGARTQEIGGILDVIDDVGDQTSLLALNAAIIAAQAGEQGRAFSVVADEIRDLADRVLVSTKEIGGLIRAVQSESEHAVGAIERGSASVLRGVELAVEAGRTLEEVHAASSETGTRIESVVASVRAQVESLDHVAALAQRVEETARELALARAEEDRDQAVVSGAVVSLHRAVETIRAAARDQAASLARVEAELSLAGDAARGVTSALDAQTRLGQDLGRVLEVGSERVRAVAAVGDALAAAHEALRIQSDALHTSSSRRAAPPAHPSPPARTPGERR